MCSTLCTKLHFLNSHQQSSTAHSVYFIIHIKQFSWTLRTHNQNGDPTHLEEISISRHEHKTCQLRNLSYWPFLVAHKGHNTVHNILWTRSYTQNSTASLQALYMYMEYSLSKILWVIKIKWDVLTFKFSSFVSTEEPIFCNITLMYMYHFGTSLII